MRIHSLRVKNFRGYRDEIEVKFEDLTAFVGKNDIGKSTILEALDIFFNCGKGVIKLDKDDVNKEALANQDDEIRISVCFENLPQQIVIDSSNTTNLVDEYLLNSEDRLEIIKKYKNAGAEKIYIKCFHPTNPLCCDLLSKKDNELKGIIESNDIECENKRKNAVMRKAIWDFYSDSLNRQDVEIDISKSDVAKSIWSKLEHYLPMYSLFQSDRKNSDGDSEIQDPLKEAVKIIMGDTAIQQKLDEVAVEVSSKLNEVSQRTLQKLQEINPEIANNLNPVIPSTNNLKWVDVFKNVSISSDEDIPINKRGSGIKRLILLSFFRAEAEKRRTENNLPSVIYAIEEPETSQHTEHQKLLVKAFKDLSNENNTQILLTTHSANIVKQLDFAHLRLIRIDNICKTVERVLPAQLSYPSLNEVNYIAFGEITEEYHNELYGKIEMNSQLSIFKQSQPTVPYNKVLRNGQIRVEQICLTEFIRHQIHHPENTNNTRFTHQDLKDSIELMRNFIIANP